MTFQRVILFALLLLGLAGCEGSRQVQVNVSSLGSPAPAAARYVLLPDEARIDPTDLQFAEFAEQVRFALANRGYRPAASKETADIAVMLGFGIGEPRQQSYAYSSPVWGPTGPAYFHPRAMESSFYGYRGYRGQTFYAPSYGVSGYTTQIGIVTTYTRFLSLHAIDLAEYRATNHTRRIWQVTAESTGQSGDLRAVFPAMVVAIEPHIGTNSGQAVEVRVNLDDPKIAAVKSSLKR
jgi:hypothetical protein